MRISASWFGSLGSTAYKDVARLIRATESGLPSDRHPDRIERRRRAQSCQGMAWQGRSTPQGWATANLDSSCARRLHTTAGWDEETGPQVEQKN